MMPRRPLLRYHGGKWRLATWIIKHFPEHRVYTEAFGGAALAPDGELARIGRKCIQARAVLKQAIVDTIKAGHL